MRWGFVAEVKTAQTLLLDLARRMDRNGHRDRKPKRVTTPQRLTPYSVFFDRILNGFEQAASMQEALSRWSLISSTPAGKRSTPLAGLPFRI
jgi:hypothetical protein